MSRGFDDAEIADHTPTDSHNADPEMNPDFPIPCHLSLKNPKESNNQQEAKKAIPAKKSAGTVWRQVVMVLCFILTFTFQ
jgi:hypothetical protein